MKKKASNQRPLLLLAIVSGLFVLTFVVLFNADSETARNIRTQAVGSPSSNPFEPVDDPDEPGEWPPNHAQYRSDSWPYDHTYEVSRTWPGNLHKTSTSGWTFPGNHDLGISLGWLDAYTPDHDSIMSLYYDYDTPGHTVIASGSEDWNGDWPWEDWPAGHTYFYSNKWVRDNHRFDVSRRWPPNHESFTLRADDRNTPRPSRTPGGFF